MDFLSEAPARKRLSISPGMARGLKRFLLSILESETLVSTMSRIVAMLYAVVLAAGFTSLGGFSRMFRCFAFLDGRLTMRHGFLGSFAALHGFTSHN